MKLLRRRPTDADLADEVADEVVQVASTKGRPTPKRRDSAPRRGPVQPAPRTRKEAMQWQRQTRVAKKGGAAQPARNSPEYRAALRRGDPDVLPRRDQGPVRKLARDWVDSRRMLSNFLLLLFPVMFIGFAIPALNFLVIVLFVIFLGEWYLTGRRIRALAQQRLGTVKEGVWSLGFYAGSRAYMPRRFRMPRAQVQRGDTI